MARHTARRGARRRAGFLITKVEYYFRRAAALLEQSHRSKGLRADANGFRGALTLAAGTGRAAESPTGSFSFLFCTQPESRVPVSAMYPYSRS
jgi:hypothetical protein